MTFDPGFDTDKWDAQIDDVLVLYQEQGVQKRTRQLPLRPARQDTGDEPLEMRPEYGDVWAQGDFSGGMGQLYSRRPNSDKTAYAASFAVDLRPPPGRFTNSFQMPELGAITPFAKSRLEVVADKIFVPINTGGNHVTYSTGGAWTPEAGPAATILDIASNGADLYAAVSNAATPLFKRDSAGTWASYKSGGVAITLGGVGASVIRYLKKRLMVASDSSSPPVQIYEVTGATATPTALDATLPTNSMVTDFWEYGPYIYAGLVNQDQTQGEIRWYGQNSALTALEPKGSKRLDGGEVILAGCEYAGFCFLGGYRRDATGNELPLLWRAQQQADGSLIWENVFEGKAAGFGIRAFVPLGPVLLISVKISNTDTDGLGTFNGVMVYDPARQSLSPVFFASDVANPPVSLAVFQNKVWVARSDGVYVQSTDRMPAAYLITSMDDFGNAGLKLWDSCDLQHDALNTGESIKIYFTSDAIDQSPAWTLLGTANTVGAKNTHFDFPNNTTSVKMALKFELTGGADTTKAPAVRNFSVRAFPTSSTPEFILERFIRIFKDDRRDPEDSNSPAITDQDTPSIMKSLMNKAWKVFTVKERDATYRVQQVDFEVDPPGIPVEAGKEGYVAKATFIGKVTA